MKCLTGGIRGEFNMKNKNDISFQFYLFSNKISCISMSIYLKNLITIDFRVIFCTLKTYKNPAQKVTEQSGTEKPFHKHF